MNDDLLECTWCGMRCTVANRERVRPCQDGEQHNWRTVSFHEQQQERALCERSQTDDTEQFGEMFKFMQACVHSNAKAHGWHDTPVDPVTALALIHCEVSEAVEGLRHGNPPSEHIPEFSAIEEELADVVIRCMDLAGAKGYRLAEAIIAKHRFNESRPHKHGSKHF